MELEGSGSVAGYYQGLWRRGAWVLVLGFADMVRVARNAYDELVFSGRINSTTTQQHYLKLCRDVVLYLRCRSAGS